LGERSRLHEIGGDLSVGRARIEGEGCKMIRRLMCAAVAAAIATPALAASKAKTKPAAGKDVLIVVLKQEVHGKDGIHKQLMPRDNCMKFLLAAQANVRAGQIVTLTLEDPAATGTVVSVTCVHADGSYDSVETITPSEDKSESDQ
jgi:hypothetical protein